MSGAPENRSKISRANWLAQMTRLGEAHGSFQPLGEWHSALYLKDSPTLLVTFESAIDIRARASGVPKGWTIAEEAGWSQLTLMSEGETWFRHPQVYGYFDELIDSGFFDDFDHIVFYGAGNCGYAAAAFSVAAPGATVILVNPQATLDPRVTEWDPRFAPHRRVDFTTRYGYAPDMLEAAHRAFVLYDPEDQYDAMHTALFTRPNVVKLRCRHLGPDLETELLQMGILTEVIDAACEGHLTDRVFHQLFRARRDNLRYLRRLLSKTEAHEHDYLAAVLCKSVTDRADRAPRFRRRLRELEAQFSAAGHPLPWMPENGDAPG